MSEITSASDPGWAAALAHVQVVASEGIHPDADSINNDILDLRHIGNKTCQLGHSLCVIATCIRTISSEHDGCTITDCETCTAINDATSVIHALDIVNGTAVWAYDGRSACGHVH